MNREQLEFIVKRLVMQFHEYADWNSVIASLEAQLLQESAAIAQRSGQELRDVLAASSASQTLQEIKAKLELARLDQQRISDEMSYQNHLIWMMYKHRAYVGTQNEIPTVGAFQRHCSPKDYICTKRYAFLKDWLAGKDVDIEDERRYPKDMPLSEYYMQPVFWDLLEDIAFLKQWKQYEYYVANSSIAKWQHYPSLQ